MGKKAVEFNLRQIAIEEIDAATGIQCKVCNDNGA
jgi:hypothetical protein